MQPCAYITYFRLSSKNRGIINFLTMHIVIELWDLFRRRTTIELFVNVTHESVLFFKYVFRISQPNQINKALGISMISIELQLYKQEIIPNYPLVTQGMDKLSISFYKSG